MSDQANGWFLTNIFPKLNLKDDRHIKILELQMDHILESGGTVPREYYEALIKAYPLNVDYKISFSALLFKIGRYEEAVDQLERLYYAYQYNRDAGALPSVDWQRFMRILANRIDAVSAGDTILKALGKDLETVSDGEKESTRLMRNYLRQEFAVK